MRKLFFLLPIIFVCLQFNSQAQESVNSLNDSGYLFQKFEPGKVVMKSGSIETGQLNYDVFNQAIVFLSDGKVMTLTNLLDIDSIIIAEDIFIPVKDKFYKIASNTPIRLLITFEAKPLHLVATSDHTGTSKQDANVVFNTVSNVYTNGVKKEGTKYVCVMKYWLKNGVKIYRANYDRELAKVFGDKSSIVLQYSRDKKIDFRSVDQVRELVEFAQQ